MVTTSGPNISGPEISQERANHFLIALKLIKHIKLLPKNDERSDFEAAVLSKTLARRVIDGENPINVLIDMENKIKDARDSKLPWSELDEKK